MLAIVVLISGCSGTGDEALIVYSGRSEPLMKELVERYKKKVEVPVRVKYGKDAQLLGALKEEGSQTPADIYLANTTGALSNAVQNDMLSKLPDSVLDRAHRFVPSNKRWAPISARFRVLAYNPSRVDPSTLPDSVLDLPSEFRFKRKIGWTPTYSSFQDFVTGLRILEGPETTRE
ncbi:MAG: hypothetical protein ABEK50_04765 [bacterium]